MQLHALLNNREREARGHGQSSGGSSDALVCAALAPWLENAIDQASQDFFGRPAMYMGEGGTIPFIGMLGEKFPGAQFMITGVLGPHSNAHGPNEFLHLDCAEKVTVCVAKVIADHHARQKDR